MKNWSRKKIRTESHIDFIESCIKKDFISKGFQLKWSPSYCTTSAEASQISTILDDTSRKLMITVQSHNKDKLNRIDNQIKCMWRQAEQEMNDDQVRQIHTIIERERFLSEKRVSEQKNRKLNNMKKNHEYQTKHHQKLSWRPMKQNVSPNVMKRYGKIY